MTTLKHCSDSCSAHNKQSERCQFEQRAAYQPYTSTACYSGIMTTHLMRICMQTGSWSAASYTCLLITGTWLAAEGCMHHCNSAHRAVNWQDSCVGLTVQEVPCCDKTAKCSSQQPKGPLLMYLADCWWCRLECWGPDLPHQSVTWSWQGRRCNMTHPWTSTCIEKSLQNWPMWPSLQTCHDRWLWGIRLSKWAHVFNAASICNSHLFKRRALTACIHLCNTATFKARSRPA